MRTVLWLFAYFFIFDSFPRYSPKFDREYWGKLLNKDSFFCSYGYFSSGNYEEIINFFLFGEKWYNSRAPPPTSEI